MVGTSSSIGYFEAEVTIYTAAQGGRQTPAYNGIRWDFALADDSDPLRLFMIWPSFQTCCGEPLPAGVPLPVSQKLIARFYPDRRHIDTLPLSKIVKGTVFYCHEGERRVAAGVVTDVKNLFAASVE